MDGIERPTFSLKVLGGFQLRRSDVTVDLPTRKLACLLTYLACTGPTPQPREKLANLLWGSSNDDRARHNLRQAVSKIRQVLGPHAIVNEGEAIALALGVLDCDAVRLDRLTRENSPTSNAAAAELYGGPLLEDVFVNETAWSEWLLMERERLSDRAIGAMVRHGGHELNSGNTATALRFGQQAVALNTFREDAHRLVLKSLAAAGRTSEAFKHFQDLVVFFKSELDADPDEETRLLVADLGRKKSASPPIAPENLTQRGPSHPVPSVPVSLPHRAAGDLPATDASPAAFDTTTTRAPAHVLDVPRRRLVSVLVCDLVTPLSQSDVIDPEDMRALVKSFHATAADVAARFGGFCAPIPGSAVHIYFGYPTTHEHDAAQAVRAGMAIVESFANNGAAFGPRVQARVGIASGLVVVDHDLDINGVTWPAAIGEAPSHAMQLQTLAAPGQVIVSNRMRPLLRQIFDLRALDGIAHRGEAQQPDAWVVCGERNEVDRLDAQKEELLTPLVGRQEEIDLLLRRWDQAKGGAGRVVLVSGEPGIGKSRIVESLLLSLDHDRPVRLRYYCSAHHTMRPLHPYMTQIERSAGLSSAQAPADKLDKLETLLRPASTDLARDMALVADVLMIPTEDRYPALTQSAQQKREMVMLACLEQLESLAAQGPVVIIFEDIHWIDATSLDLLDRTMARIAHLPVLLIVTFRPEHQPIWIGQPHVTMQHLNRLGRQDSADIMAQITQGKPLPRSIADQIIDHADGVPLFIKELSKHVLESGLLHDAADDDVLEGKQRPVAMPTTLQSSLIARLDQLGAFREVALVGSAIGRTFSDELVAAVLDVDRGHLDAALARMTAAGLVSRRGSPPDASYSFTHALMCDAAYGMMLKDQRRRLHARIADELIAGFSGHPESAPETVAHHLSEAGRTIEAVQHWVAASRIAKKRWANREGLAFLTLALNALAGLPDSPETLQQAIDLHFEARDSLTPLGEFGRIFDHLRDAKALIEKLDDPERLCQYHAHMCHSLMMSGRASAAIQFGQDAQALAASLDDVRLLVEAKVFLGTSFFTIMDYPRAEHLFLDVIALTDAQTRDQTFRLTSFPQITARVFLTRINGVLGDFDKGILYGEDAMRRATELNHPYSLSLATWGLADLYMTQGQIAKAIPLFEQGLTISRKWDFTFLVAGHAGSLGHARALLGRPDEGLALLEKAVTLFDTMRNQFALSLFLVPLAEACVLTGRLDTARDLAQRAVDLAHENGQRFGEASALHILAEAAAHGGDLEQARKHYTGALAVAERFGMRPLVARCRHGLGDIHLRMARPDKARVNFDIAAAMYRDMAMGFWLEKAELNALL